MSVLLPQGEIQARVLSAKEARSARGTRAASSSRLRVKLQDGDRRGPWLQEPPEIGLQDL